MSDLRPSTKPFFISFACHTPREITPVTGSTEHQSTCLFCFRRPPYCCALANIRLVQHQLWFSRGEVGLRPLWHHKGLLCTHSTLLVFVPLATAPRSCLCFPLFQDTQKIQTGRYCGWAVNRGLITLFNGDTGVFVFDKVAEGCTGEVFTLRTAYPVLREASGSGRVVGPWQDWHRGKLPTQTFWSLQSI